MSDTETPEKKSSGGSVGAAFGVSLVVSAGVAAGALLGLVQPQLDELSQSARAAASQLESLSLKAAAQSKALEALQAEVARRAETLTALEAAVKVAAEKRAAEAAAAAKAEAEAKANDPYAKAPSRGEWNAAVTLVMLGDFQDPMAARVQPTLKALEAKYGKQLRLVFKNHPTRPQAKLAAQAGLAAHEQGKFWALHDVLLANQAKLDRKSLDAHAQAAGLDAAKFAAALDGKAFEAQVAADQAEALKLGAGAGPTFVVGTAKVVGAQPLEAFSKVIDEALAKTAAKPQP
jgi:protein-disulfide isomerase